MGAELARKRAGEKTRTGMSEKQLSEFATKKIHIHGASDHELVVMDYSCGPGESHDATD